MNGAISDDEVAYLSHEEDDYYEEEPVARSHDDLMFQRRKRAHHGVGAFGVTRARYSGHYDNLPKHSTTLPIASHLNRSLRYGKEPNILSCHPPRDRKPKIEAVFRSPRPKLISRSCQAKARTHDMYSQASMDPPNPIPVKRSTKNFSVQCQLPSIDDMYRELIALIKGLKQGTCTGNHVPEELVNQTRDLLQEVSALLKRLMKQNDHQVKILTVCEQIQKDMGKEKIQPCEGPHISEQMITKINLLMTEVANLLKQPKPSLDENTLTRIVDKSVGDRVHSLKKMMKELKEEHHNIMLAIQKCGGGNGDCPGPHVDENTITNIYSMLTELMKCLEPKTEPEAEDSDEDTEDVIDKCTCAALAFDLEYLNSKEQDEWFVERCRKCQVSMQGRNFLTALGSPNNRYTEINNVYYILGRLVSAINRDEPKEIRKYMNLLKRETPAWHKENMLECYEALLLVALTHNKKRAAGILSVMVDVRSLVHRLQREAKSDRISLFLQNFNPFPNAYIMKSLLEDMPDKDKSKVIKELSSATNSEGTSTLFVAIRRGDKALFKLLVENGADLDLIDDGKSIFHEIIFTAKQHIKDDDASKWKDAMSSMMDSIYANARKWLVSRMPLGHRDRIHDGSSTALRYLMSITDTAKNLNVIQYASDHAPAYIMEKILHHPPYQFEPDPFEYGYSNGMIGYVVDDIESSLADRGKSVIERVLRRSPEEAAKILQLEPLNVMIRDKWEKYWKFYFVWFFCYLLYMIIFSLCALRRPIGAQSVSEMYQNREDWIRLVGEIIILVLIPFFFYGEVRDFIRDGWVWPNPKGRYGFFRWMNFIFVILLITVILLRFSFNENEDCVLSVCLLIGWMNAIQFLAAWKRGGMFPFIMHSVFVDDILTRFLWVFLLVLAGTSTATWCLYQATEVNLPEMSNSTFWPVPYTLFKLTFGLTETEYVNEARIPEMGIVLFMIYIYLGIILLFNLLIAMMTDTYGRIRRMMENAWIWVEGCYALLLDRRLPHSLCIRYIPQSSVTVNENLTVLRYLKRKDVRLDSKNREVYVVEHVVLLPTDSLVEDIEETNPEDIAELFKEKNKTLKFLKTT